MIVKLMIASQKKPSFSTFLTAFLPLQNRMMCRLSLLGIIYFLFCLLSPLSWAQNVIAVVNRIAITDFDVQQRIRIAQITERRKLDAKTALQELIDDQVKQAEARRLGYRVTEDGVDSEFARIAKLNRQSASQFGDALRQAGIEPNAMREKLRAEVSWNAIIRDQSRGGADLGAQEIDQAVTEALSKQKRIFDYQLRSVIFIVPLNNPATVGERERAAVAARARFNSCATDFEELRSMADVAVRPLINRSSDNISPELASLLEQTPVDRMTPPQRTDQGIEVVAVCNKIERSATATLRTDVINSLSEKKLEARLKARLAELRAKTSIQYKR